MTSDEVIIYSLDRDHSTNSPRQLDGKIWEVFVNFNIDSQRWEIAFRKPNGTRS